MTIVHARTLAAVAVAGLLGAVLLAVPSASADGDDAPQNVTAVASSSASGTIEVSWDAPSTGEPIGYSLRFDEEVGNGDWQEFGDAVPATEAVPTTVDGFTDGTTYRVRVRALYDDERAVEATSNSVVPYDLPGAPGISGAEPADGAITVSWGAASPNGRTVTSYTISVTPADSNDIEVSGTTRSAVLSGLSNDQTYEVSVTATNLRGEGPSSATLEATPQSTLGPPPDDVDGGDGGETPDPQTPDEGAEDGDGTPGSGGTPEGGAGTSPDGDRTEPPAAPDEDQPGGFGDVSPSSVHADSIERLVEAGITRGCRDGAFCPEQPVSRQQMATFLTQAFELSAAAEPRDFDDVPQDAIHGPGIAAIAAAGITTGCGPDRFCPTDPVLRGQMATFLAVAGALDVPTAAVPFGDVGEDHRHRDGIAAVHAAEITRGCAADRFCPAEPVSRAQMASFLVAALDL